MAGFFDEQYFKDKPALAGLEKTQEPSPEHIRACLLEMARDIIKMKKQELQPVQPPASQVDFDRRW